MTVPDGPRPVRLAFSRLLLVLLKQNSVFIAGFCSMLRKFPQPLEVPCVSVVTPLAKRKVIAAKSSFPVVARHATQGTACRMMIERFGRSHLSSLRHSRSNLMTLVAIYFLMVCVAEAYFECRCEFRRPSITSHLMTNSARRYIAAVRLRARSVATIASRVGVESRRY